MRATQPLKHTCKRIYFIRHGQSEANALKDSNDAAKFQDGKYMGNPSDIPEVRDAKLTALGRAQAACWHTPNALAGVSRINTRSCGLFSIASGTGDCDVVLPERTKHTPRVFQSGA